MLIDWDRLGVEPLEFYPLCELVSCYTPSGRVLIHWNYFRVSSAVRARKLKSHPCLLSQFTAAVFIYLSEENLVPVKCPSISEKENSHWSNGEVIRRKRLGLLSDDVILLHDNTHTARKTQKLMQKFKWEI
ncbi:hypothetical protein AVEN_199306-1 [Araneus ventricosus]|uniref:Uncharacterized protein n=1 Tax=Araneus ventricosus TaxID=182803 RepID=A0A4Y2H9M9_ARAVE|nr:hypothetical protein AVEN_199306-1 [Araneus ventricosus]